MITKMNQWIESINENNESEANNAAMIIINQLKRSERKKGKSMVIEKRVGGVAIVSRMIGSDVFLKIYDDKTIALNKNPMEIGGKYKFDNFDDIIEFCVWYYKEMYKDYWKSGYEDDTKQILDFRELVKKKLTTYNL